MAILTDDQIAQVAVDNGFPTTDKNNLAVCVAIAKAESSGQTDATNNNSNGTSDKGLWQINDVHNDKLAGQDRFDQNVNAKLMLMISNNGTNWQPWSTYNNGAYQRYLGEAMTAVAGKDFIPGSNNTAGGAAGSGNTQSVSSSNPVSGIENFFSGLANPNTLIRIGQMYGGMIIILVGIVFIFREPITKAAKVGVMAVAPEAAAVL
jgi:hypothetical protein